MKVWFFVHYYELNDIRPAGKEKYKMYSTIELQSQFTICSKLEKQYKKEKYVRYDFRASQKWK